jgi:hypothetical protein
MPSGVKSVADPDQQVARLLEKLGSLAQFGLTGIICPMQSWIVIY